jgi:tRNA uridine 5-carboxymethylaminomethyl modification enzyme
MYSGRILGRGPRYCPSIEDKIDRFASRDRHQLFIEPEGWNTVEYYVNGFSSSLPEEVQFSALRKVKGFEHAKFFRPGYAVEYDYFPPDQLNFTLETKVVENLYFAGQINGTTGYEEAAAQGLMAGINAHLKITGQKPLVLNRSQAYIGVLIDDLITKGTEEPYRMFTSRAEFRLLLRQDNADQRLTPIAAGIGMVSSEILDKVKAKYALVNDAIAFLKSESLFPDMVNPLLEILNSAQINQKQKAAYLLLRPQVYLNDLINEVDFIREYFARLGPDNEEIIDETEIVIKYENYIVKEQDLADKVISLDNLRIAPEFDFNLVSSLSIEAREKLTKIKPSTLGQASRISGVSPSDISVLIVYLGR